MAGIGVKLTNIYKKNTLTTDIIGMGYSMAVTIAPMLVVIGALIIMEYYLDFSSVDYLTRELFSCTVLYIFIFSLLTASPFNSVLSKYMSDIIYEEHYEDILPCYYVGMIMNILQKMNESKMLNAKAIRDVMVDTVMAVQKRMTEKNK